MLKITDKKFFVELVADAIVQVHLTCRTKRTRNRWIKAIAKAAAVILSGDPTFLHWNPVRKILYFWSADSDEIYQIGETCQCPAFLQPKKKPCYHRAMRQLVKTYFDLQKKPGQIPEIDFPCSVFFDDRLPVVQKIELLQTCIFEGRDEAKPYLPALA